MACVRYMAEVIQLLGDQLYFYFFWILGRLCWWSHAGIFWQLRISSFRSYQHIWSRWLKSKCLVLYNFFFWCHITIKKFVKLWNKIAICKRFGRRVYCKYLTFRRHWEGKTFVILYTGPKASLLMVRISEGILAFFSMIFTDKIE